MQNKIVLPNTLVEISSLLLDVQPIVRTKPCRSRGSGAADWLLLVQRFISHTAQKTEVEQRTVPRLTAAATQKCSAPLGRQLAGGKLLSRLELHTHRHGATEGVACVHGVGEAGGGV